MLVLSYYQRQKQIQKNTRFEEESKNDPRPAILGIHEAWYVIPVSSPINLGRVKERKKHVCHTEASETGKSMRNESTGTRTYEITLKLCF
mmetsp:Transcript_51585/g.70294  ORF Transcript_51585/g.70294 Transcript_51585/m.70294 type:complete len:90 (-) Transcript_51585:351-620(-)